MEDKRSRDDSNFVLGREDITGAPTNLDTEGGEGHDEDDGLEGNVDSSKVTLAEGGSNQVTKEIGVVAKDPKAGGGDGGR